MKAKQSSRGALNAPKDKANPPRRQRPAGAGTPRRRRAVEAQPQISARLKRVLAMFPHPELAKICGVTRQGVHQWADFPAKHALAVEKASGGKLTKEYLAPNFYPRPA